MERTSRTAMLVARNRMIRFMKFVLLGARLDGGLRRDRKSTRLNSSHLVISYAVFCLKKKKFQDSSKLLRYRLQVGLVSALYPCMPHRRYIEKGQTGRARGHNPHLHRSAARVCDEFRP